MTIWIWGCVLEYYLAHFLKSKISETLYGGVIVEVYERSLDMAISNIKVSLPCDIQKVWEVVTALEDCAWRSDLSKIEIVNENQFIEYTKDGYATTFTITVKEPCKRYEFDMENGNMQGHWTGIFTGKGNSTELDFTEDVAAKKLLMKPFVKGYLKKQQELYVSDLKKFLER